MLIATRSAVYRIDEGDEEPAPLPLPEGAAVRRVASGPSVHVVALDGGRLLVRSAAGGERDVQPRDTGIAERIESLLILDEDRERLLLGTQGAHLYRFGADGEAQLVESFERVEGRDRWHTPWGGPPAVRSLARSGELIYADIHVGCIVRSDDGGRTWRPTCEGIDEDVHQVATCPTAPRRVYANTASGVYVSDDAGGSWEHRAADLDERYGRAIAVHPAEPDLLLASVSDGPRGGDGQLFVSRDAGRRWSHVSEGFPASLDHNIDTFHLAFTPDGRAWAVAGKELYVGEKAAARWRRWWEAPEAIVMLG